MPIADAIPRSHRHGDARGSGVLPAGTPVTGWGWATVCSIGWGVVGVVGLLQLSVAVARTVPRRFAPDR